MVSYPNGPVVVEKQIWLCQTLHRRRGGLGNELKVFTVALRQARPIKTVVKGACAASGNLIQNNSSSTSLRYLFA